MTSARSAFRPRARRGFNLIELMIALAITASLLSAVMVAIDASFMAYQTTTEVASAQTVTRLVVNRASTLIRTGYEFAPYPLNPQVDSVIESDWIEFQDPNGAIYKLDWVPAEEILYIHRDPEGDGTYIVPPSILLENMVKQFEAPNGDDTNDYIEPFTLEWEPGKARLFRCTIDLAVVPDDNMSVDLDGDNIQTIRYVVSVMPRLSAFASD